MMNRSRFLSGIYVFQPAHRTELLTAIEALDFIILSPVFHSSFSVTDTSARHARQATCASPIPPWHAQLAIPLPSIESLQMKHSASPAARPPPRTPQPRRPPLP